MHEFQCLRCLQKCLHEMMKFTIFKFERYKNLSLKLYLSKVLTTIHTTQRKNLAITIWNKFFLLGTQEYMRQILLNSINIEAVKIIFMILERALLIFYHMVLCGTVLYYIRMYGYFWLCLGMYGYIRICVGLYEYLCVYYTKCY